MHPQCRSNAAGLETFWGWSFELQRSVRATYDYLLEELLIEDDCQRCQRKFWRQMRFAFLWCPTCRKLVSKEEPEAEADPKWQCTRRWSWACMACNTQNWPSRIRCRTCKTSKLLEPAWLQKERDMANMKQQKECENRSSNDCERVSQYLGGARSSSSDSGAGLR